MPVRLDNFRRKKYFEPKNDKNLRDGRLILDDVERKERVPRIFFSCPGGYQ